MLDFFPIRSEFKFRTIAFGVTTQALVWPPLSHFDDYGLQSVLPAGAMTSLALNIGHLRCLVEICKAAHLTRTGDMADDTGTIEFFLLFFENINSVSMFGFHPGVEFSPVTLSTILGAKIIRERCCLRSG